MKTSFYVTGTDTGIGKTYSSCALLHRYRAQGQRALGMKPIASGCELTASGLRNDDAEQLRAASSFLADYADVNPYAFADPIAPHLAARDCATTIDLGLIESAYRRLAADADCVVVEGVGGWAAPLGESLMQTDLVHALDLDVILVVGLRLGCINHALLSARAIQADGCRLVGWIANRVDPDMLRADDSLSTLTSLLTAPLLGVVAHATNESVPAFEI